MEEENERYKYEDIFIDNWISKRYFWKGKPVVFTKHAFAELEKLKKPLEFALLVLEKGEHRLVSKKQNKYNVIYPCRKKHICLSYSENENIILIHIKPTGRT